MRKRIFRVFLSLMLTGICLLTAAPDVLAAATVGVGIPVEVKVTGNRPTTPQTYQLLLQAENSNSPMPSGSKDGACSITITGSGNGVFPDIVFDTVGVYSYTVRQVKGTNSRCTYDDTVYDVNITVTYTADGSALEATTAIRESGSTEKVQKAKFVNQYAYPPSDTPKTGDSFPFALYGALTVVSIGILVGLYLTRKKKETE